MSNNEELPTIFDSATLVRKGLCPVMAIQGQEKTAVQSHQLYFEQHGTGPDKLVLIMGLNTSSFAWGYQLRHFAKTHSVLVFDNRGVGNSDTPKGPYTTSQMADDAITLIDYLGWNKGRELHIVGVSLGGMISQEIAFKIPERILSLTLIVTKAGSAGIWANMTPWHGMSSLAVITFTGNDEKKSDLVLPMLYPDAWLDAKSEDVEGQTNREVAKKDLMNRIMVQRKQTMTGVLSQTAAARSHNITPEQLHKIGETIPKILILTGDIDHLIKPVNSEWIHKHMPEAEYQVWEGVGHGLIGQVPKKFNETLERVIKEGKEKGSQAPWKASTRPITVLSMMLAGVGLRSTGPYRTLLNPSISSRFICQQQRAALSTFSGRPLLRPATTPSQLGSPTRPQMRHKSIFEHRWFSPESKPGEPPRQSYRVFWTVSFLLASFSAAYLKWGEPYLNDRFASSSAAAAVSNEPVFDKDNFLPFVIKKIEPYNWNTKLITFSTPKGQPTNLPVASALFARPVDENGPLDDKGNPVVRWYTPVSDASVPGEFTVMIKKYDDGKLTPYIHSLKVGDKLAFKGPIKKWAYKPNEFEHVGLVGGGSGITPLYQIIGHALKDKNNTTKFTLLYGSLTEEDILLRQEFDSLKKKYPSTFDVVYFVDKKTGKDPAVQTGYIGKDVIQKYLKADLGPKIKVFVCGPPGQMKAISGMKAGMKQGELSGALKEAGFTEDQVYKF